MDDCGEFESLLAAKVRDGNELGTKLGKLPQVAGKSKLERKLLAEMRFLTKLQSPDVEIRKEHINSSNLVSLAAIVDVLARCSGPSAVLKRFRWTGLDGSRKSLEVDVVSEGGAVWHKAVARNAEALDNISRGKSDCGQKPLVHHADCFAECARQNQHHFQTPQVIFFFASGVSRSLAEKLRKRNVQVCGSILDDCQPWSSDDEDDDESWSDTSSLTSDSGSLPSNTDEQLLSPMEPSDDRLFLDITTMVAYVSAMTNGHVNFKFAKRVFNQHAEWERLRPLKPQLERLFAGRRLVTCQTAQADFQGLINKMGGPTETERARELLERVTVIEDQLSDRVAGLVLSSGVKERSRIIFGTADHHCCVIVTANVGFVNSAFSQGVTIAAHLHEPRVLTEDQEKRATPLFVSQD